MESSNSPGNSNAQTGDRITKAMFFRAWWPALLSSVGWSLSDIADAVPYAFYHLDGIGALKHLDSVLSIKAMRAVQWQPGEGHMAMYQWIDVIKHILDSGKSCQVYANAQDVFMLTKEVGAKGMLYIVTDTQDNILKMADSLRLPSYDPKDCSMQ